MNGPLCRWGLSSARTSGHPHSGVPGGEPGTSVGSPGACGGNDLFGEPRSRCRHITVGDRAPELLGQVASQPTSEGLADPRDRAPTCSHTAISPPVASAVGGLAEWENRDPADRLITATAQVFGAAVLTNDDAIRDSGLVQVV